jgi:adenylate cyclase
MVRRCTKVEGLDRPRMARRVRKRLIIAGTTVSTSAAALIAIYLLVVFPYDEFDGGWARTAGFVASALYVACATVYATRRAGRTHAPMLEWLQSGRPATDADRRRVLRVPAISARITFLCWLFAIPFFAVPASFVDGHLGAEVAVTLFLGALVTSAADFLIAERITRPVLALALVESGAPDDAGWLGIGPRLMLTWLLCSAVPILMIALVPVGRHGATGAELVGPIMFVAAVAIVTGLVGTKLATVAVTRPIRALRRATDALTAGETGVRVTVDDASEIGRLQAGFNEMVAGLRERELLRDLYGRQVGVDVARESLERGTELGGQEREVSVLFVDVIGSTTLAQRESPERVVELLNDFFAIVVRVIHGHGGLVNKFEGDAALCVFGAPAPQPDHAARALAAARALRAELDAHVAGFDAAIGVAGGPAVAGYVGAEDRFEYTVIGDPVNEASRLTELAKQHACRLLASATTLDAATGPERSHWELDGEVVLRGRDAPTRLAILAGTEAPPVQDAPGVTALG